MYNMGKPKPVSYEKYHLESWEAELREKGWHFSYQPVQRLQWDKPSKMTAEINYPFQAPTKFLNQSEMAI